MQKKNTSYCIFLKLVELSENKKDKASELLPTHALFYCLKYIDNMTLVLMSELYKMGMMLWKTFSVLSK